MDFFFFYCARGVTPRVKFIYFNLDCQCSGGGGWASGVIVKAHMCVNIGVTVCVRLLQYGGIGVQRKLQHSDTNIILCEER